MSHVRSLGLLGVLAVATATGSLNASAQEIIRVFVIAMENHNWICRHQQLRTASAGIDKGSCALLFLRSHRTCMVTLERITLQNVSAFKAVRLRALQDTPSAFGSTYARESQFSDAECIKRAGNLCGERSIGYMAMEGRSPCGLALSLLHESDTSRAQLISMWTAPTQRQKGTGRLLVNEILNWCRERGAKTLDLMVTSSNESAIRFYERLGFTRTGRTEPYPNDPALIEYEMSRPVG